MRRRRIKLGIRLWKCLNRSSYAGCPCLRMDCRRKALPFKIKYDVSCRYLVFFVRLKMFPSTRCLLRIFKKSWPNVEFCQTLFFFLLPWFYVFFFSCFTFNMMGCIDFLNVELAFAFLVKTLLILMCYCFYKVFQFVGVIFRILTFIFMNNIDLLKK